MLHGTGFWACGPVRTKSGVTDLGTLGGADPDYLFCSEAGDINDAGQIVGWSSFSPDNEGSSACVDGIPNSCCSSDARRDHAGLGHPAR